MTGEHDNGNGSLMRILPASIYTISKNKSLDERFKIVNSVSKLTHGHIRTFIACSIYTFIVEEILNEDNSLNDAINKGIKNSVNFFKDKSLCIHELRYFDRILARFIFNLEEDDISSSGYVVATLEAALWALINTNSYSEAVLKAINLGGDTDTTGAVCGSLAGLYYGYDSIPLDWANTLAKKDYIESIVLNFYNSLNDDLTTKI